MLTGYTALVKDLDLSVPSPHVESRFARSVRRSEIHDDKALETYPQRQQHSGDIRDHLQFALQKEPTDLSVLCAMFKKTGPDFIRDWVLDKPTGVYSRKAWFLYEFITGQKIDLPKAKKGRLSNVLDPKQHIVAARRMSTRHRLYNNLLGVSGFCPTVRRTQKLTSQIAKSWDKKASTMTTDVDPDLLRRAVSFLYTKETKSTFEIEGEVADRTREERFVAALINAAKFDSTDKEALIFLQNSIVDPRYADTNWRDSQNYVGETVSGFREVVHLVCPKPEDVNALMMAWAAMGNKLLSDPVDPVVASALVSFGFVFVHPFNDGNGRIHRFLIHNVLAKKEFSPDGIIFPVSVAIIRDMPAYDAALERFSKPILSLVDRRLIDEQTPDQHMVVDGNTVDLYRYFDATPQTEYLYDRVAETIHKDLAEELDFLGAYDAAYNGVRSVVDMPDKKISLFVRLCMQNNGRLAKSKCRFFSELTRSEIEAMEAAVRKAQEDYKREAAEISN